MFFFFSVSITAHKRGVYTSVVKKIQNKIRDMIKNKLSSSVRRPYEVRMTTYSDESLDTSLVAILGNSVLSLLPWSCKF